MGVCVICLARTGKHSKKSFHKFPFKKNPSVAEKWVEWVRMVKKYSWTPCKTSIICSDHFAASALDKSTFRVELNTNSVPTILHPNNTKAVSEVQISKRKSSSDEICTASPSKKHCGENSAFDRPSISDRIPDPIALETFNTTAKFQSAEAIVESNVTSKTSALHATDECCTGRRCSWLCHDHNYENTLRTCRKKNIELTNHLKKARMINKAQKQKIKKLEKRVESLKELVGTLRKESSVCTDGL